MSNSMFYVWLLLGSFGVMTVLFFIAEAEVKNLRRMMAKQKEEDKFKEVHERITNEIQILRRDMIDMVKGVEDEVTTTWREIHEVNQKMKEKSPKGR